MKPHLSKTEWLARQLFKHYLPRDRVTYNSRPEWAVNPETNQALEYDLLFPDLKLIVEIQGRQHYRHEPGLHSDYVAFQKQQRRDTIKMHAAQAQGYRFFALSIFELREERFDPFIRRLLTDLDRPLDYRRTAVPIPLYRLANQLSRARIPTPARKRARKAWWRRAFAR